MIEKVIRYRKNYLEVKREYLNNSCLDENITSEITKFLATLKWIALQEDINYPPPRYMGSKYTLAAYALLEMRFSPSEIRRIIRF